MRHARLVHIFALFILLGALAPRPGHAAPANPLPAADLGARLAAHHRDARAFDAVVVVPDSSAYIEAIARWTSALRFPVLIDDGTDAAREDIARFVRAYRPARALWWPGDGRVWAQAIEVRTQRIEDAHARANGAANADSLAAHWREKGFAPFGVAVGATTDPAWTALLALGAAHAQPIVWVDSLGGRIGTEVDEPSFIKVRDAVERALTERAIAWRGVGPGGGVDALTLCQNAPTKVPSGRGSLALTDALGRTADGARWAWAGQVVGAEARAAYTAMCSIFLRPGSAWLFNSYEQGGGFGAFAPRAAEEAFAQRGWRVEHDQRPRARLFDLRARARTPVDAGMVFVNSSGQRRWFRIQDEDAYASELPALRVPAIVHFVHSFSAQYLDDEASIAARWLAHGAYVYVGSVDEPTLQGFQPPDAVVSRLGAGAPMGAAIRLDSAPPWKINYFGDPLAQPLSAPPARVDGALELPDAAPLDERMRADLSENRIVGALRALVMLGRDEDAARLFVTLSSERPNALTPESARAGLWALHRLGRAEDILIAAGALPVKAFDDAATVDMLWRTVRGQLGAQPDSRAVALLRDRTRSDTLADDAIELVRAIRTLEGDAAADAFAAKIIAETRNERQRERLRRRLLDSQ